MSGQQQSSEPRKGYEQVERQQSEPWGPTHPAFQQIIDQAGQLYEGGVGTELPGFSPVAGLGAVSQGAIDQLMNMGGAPGTSQFADIYNAATGPSAAETYLSGIAAGPSENNPYLEQLLNIGSENITNRVNALQSAKGRYAGVGAGGHVDALANAITEFQAPILYQAYDADRNRQMTAAGQIDAARQGGLGIGLSAAGAGAQNEFASIDRLLNAGQYQDANANAQQAADYERALWEMGGGDQAALERYLSQIGAIGGMGGTNTRLEPRTPGRDFLSTLLQIGGTVGSFF